MKKWKSQFPIYRDACNSCKEQINVTTKVTAACVRVQRDYYSGLLKTTREGVGGNVQRISDIRGQTKSSSQQRAVLVREYWMIYESF
jgi:hypothetical protein